MPNWSTSNINRPTIRSLSQEVKEIQDKVNLKFDKEQHTNETRSRIARKFITRFFIIIGIWTVVILAYNLLICRIFITNWYKQEIIDSFLLDIYSILPILISAVSWPLGFVVWYYFKSEWK